MNRDEVKKMAQCILEAWNTQDVDKVLACYTEDLIYRDPNTRGDVNGSQAMRNYLNKLFSHWDMKWFLREGYPLQENNGAAILWRATFQKKGQHKVVEANGMDLVFMQGDRIKRNEVYFDRLHLVPLMGLPGWLFGLLSRLKSA